MSQEPRGLPIQFWVIMPILLLACILTPWLGYRLLRRSMPFSVRHKPRSECSWTALPDGRLLMAGGIGRTNGRSTAFYDPRTNGFTPGGPLQVARSMHGAALLPDGRVLLAGGLADDQVWPLDLELVDPVHGGSELVGKLPGSMAHAPVLPLRDGRVLIAGLGSSDSFAVLWNPMDRSVKALPGKGIPPMGEMSAAVLGDGRALLTGQGGSGQEGTNAFLYDPAASTFRPTGPMLHDRLEHRMTLLKDGRVLVSGGFEEATLELYDPATGSFSEAGREPEAHTGGAAVPLNDGRVLIFGGSLKERSTLYDPASGRLESLDGPQGFFLTGTGLRLPDGRVLAVSDMSDAQVFDPATSRWSSYRP